MNYEVLWYITSGCFHKTKSLVNVMKCKHSLKLFHEKPFFEFVELIGKISSRHFQFGEFRD